MKILAWAFIGAVGAVILSAGLGLPILMFRAMGDSWGWAVGQVIGIVISVLTFAWVMMWAIEEVAQ